jgi:hypothetical protein
VADAAVAEAPALRSGLMFLMMKVFDCSLQLRLSCSFLFDLLLHDLVSFGHCLSSGPSVLA